ncbi:unnamed protein product [Fusarium equiseti]|uniref:Rhodopsin domain-containing protein n=1 Tax=Fusarium equiseti TaxID=61235 RepID=A0A8J2NGH5_FUSEQ|nr:unnamed protein product [Fusarium equiseti]
MVDANLRTVEPQGLARVLLGVFIFFLITTAVVVILRCFVRLRYRIFGIDDSLMLIGWVRTKDESLNGFLQIEGRKWMWVGQTIYSMSLIPLKCSICVTLLRIAVTKLHRIIVWSTIIFTIVTMLYNIIAGFAACVPVTANWDRREICSLPVIMSTGYVVSISAVISDWTCAILPVFMLYKSNMRRATKVSVSIVLGLAAVASLCTVIRLPYLKAFSDPHDYLYNVAYIVLWSTAESGIGIIAGSLPPLRKLVSSRFHFDSSTGSSPAQVTPFAGTSRAIIISQSVSGARGTRRSKVGNDWEQLDNSESASSRNIHVKVDLELQYLERPATSQESNGSREDLVHR